MMLPDQTHALSQDEPLRLDHFLHSAVCGKEAMGLSRAHGFLTAAAIGPEPLAPAEWIRLVFDEPVFADTAQADDMLGLVTRLYQDIENSFTQQDFSPVLEFVRDAAGATHMDAAPWCQGFISGMSLCREQRARHARGLLDDPLRLVFHLAEVPADSGGYGARLCDALPPAMDVVNHYWRGIAQTP